MRVAQAVGLVVDVHAVGPSSCAELIVNFLPGLLFRSHLKAREADHGAGFQDWQCLPRNFRAHPAAWLRRFGQALQLPDSARFLMSL